MSEMQEIKIEDIRVGDRIRVEYPEGDRYAGRYATEYVSSVIGSLWADESDTVYLLERPVPPFEPYWGMVIGPPGFDYSRAVCIPGCEGEELAWLKCDDTSGFADYGWMTTDWAKGKLAEGWVVIEKPEGVK